MPAFTAAGKPRSRERQPLDARAARDDGRRGVRRSVIDDADPRCPQRLGEDCVEARRDAAARPGSRDHEVDGFHNESYLRNATDQAAAVLPSDGSRPIRETRSRDGRQRRLRQARDPGHDRLGRGARRRPPRRPRRGQRGPVAVRRRPHARRDRAALEGRAAAAGRARRDRPGRVRASARLEGHRERHDGRALRRQEQLVRGVRLLVPQAVRARGRADHGRRPPEVDRRGPPAHDRRSGAGAEDVPTRSHRITRSAPGATTSWRSSTRGATPWSTCARRRSTRASSSRCPATSRRARSGAGTSRERRRSRGRRRCARTGRSRAPRSCTPCTAAKGVDGSKPITAYCRIGERSSHSWFVLRELLGHQHVRNYDGSWTEWGNMVDVPIEKGA